MKKLISVFFLFFSIYSMETTDQSGSKSPKKTWYLDPLANQSSQKKIRRITNFQRVIRYFLSKLSENLNFIKCMSHVKKSVKSQQKLKKSQNSLSREQRRLKKLDLFLEMQKDSEIILGTSNPEKRCNFIFECLNFFLKQKMRVSIASFNDFENTVLEILAFLYSKLLEMESSLDKQKKFYESYTSGLKGFQEKISTLFLKKAARTSRWAFLIKLKLQEAIRELEKNSELVKKIEGLEETEEKEENQEVVEQSPKSPKKKKKVGFKYDRKQDKDLFIYFQSFDFLMKKQKKIRVLRNIKRQTNYWLSKAALVDPLIIQTEEYKAINLALNQSPAKDNIFAVAIKERQISNLYRTLDLRSIKSLQDLSENEPATVESLKEKKELLRELAVSLAEEAEKIIDEENRKKEEIDKIEDPKLKRRLKDEQKRKYQEATTLLQKAIDLGGHKSYINALLAKINKSPFQISLDGEATSKKIRRLSASLRESSATSSKLNISKTNPELTKQEAEIKVEIIKDGASGGEGKKDKGKDKIPDK